MTHTHSVIGVFETAEAANAARHALISQGVGHDQIDVTTADTSQDNPTGEFPENDAFHNFFRSVFTGHDHEIRDHSEAARRGTTLTVHVPSRPAAEQVQQLLDQHGAVDANEFARRYRTHTGGVPLSAQGPAPGHLPAEENRPATTPEQPVAINAVMHSRIIDHPIEDQHRLR